MRTTLCGYSSLVTRYASYMPHSLTHMSRLGFIALLQNGAMSTPYAFQATPATIAELMHSANGGNIPKTFDNIAHSLTNQLRIGPQSFNIGGEVWRDELYMNVDWP